MPEHSIKELERQLKSAEGALADANKRVLQARHRLRVAKFAATGFDGCVAEYTKTGFRARGEIVRFLPVRISRYGGHLEGPVFKKDGTLGVRETSCPVEAARNLGPYTPGEASNA